MKIYKKILLSLISIAVIMLCFTCSNNGKSPDSDIPLPKHLKFKVYIINNSDLTVDYLLKEILIGGNGLENTSDIFWSSGHFDSYKSSYPEEFEDSIPQNFDYYGRYEDARIQGTISNDNSDTLIYYDCLNYDGVETLLIRLSFNGSSERILAGWPKYYYSKLPNVVLYGFSYEFGNDKKIQNHQDATGSYGVRYSINSDDPSGDITGYPPNKIYALQVTINSPDDITMEVLPETGEEFYVPPVEHEEGFN